MFDSQLTGFWYILIFHPCGVWWLWNLRSEVINMLKNALKNCEGWIKVDFWAYRALIWKNMSEGWKFCFESFFTLKKFILQFDQNTGVKTGVNCALESHLYTTIKPWWSVLLESFNFVIVPESRSNLILSLDSKRATS